VLGEAGGGEPDGGEFVSGRASWWTGCGGGWRGAGLVVGGLVEVLFVAVWQWGALMMVGAGCLGWEMEFVVAEPGGGAC
jgi:hypothetical protein